MWEECVSLTWGTLLTGALWLTSVALMVAGFVWNRDLVLMGLEVCMVSSALMVMRDNARTRRVVRACAREQHDSDPYRASLN